MDEVELSTYQSLPDYEDIDKEGAAPLEPSTPDVQESSLSDEEQPVQETDESNSEGEPISNEDEKSDEDEDTEEEAGKNKPEESDVQKYKVKVNGEELEVTLDDLKKSFMFESDYRRKTSELAEERRAIESQTKARTQELDRLRALIEESRKTVETDLQDSEAKSLRAALNRVDVASLNPEQLTQYMQAKAYCEQLEYRDKVKLDKLNALTKKYLEEQTRIQNEQWAQDQRILERDIPEVRDPVKRERLNQDISQYLVSIYGEERAREIAPTIKSKEDYKTLYYATVGKKLLETKPPIKTSKEGKSLSAKNQSGAQSISSASKKAQTALLTKIKANGARGEASEADIIKYLMS